MRSLDQLHGMPVMSTKEGKDLGRVRHGAADLAKGELIGLIVAEPEGGSEWGLAAAEITTLGQDAIMVASEAVKKPVAARMQRYRLNPEGDPLQIVTSAGRQLGTLGRVYVDAASLRIVGYEVSGHALKSVVDGTPHLPVMKGVIHGEDALVVPPQAEQHLERSTGGLRQAWARVTEFGRDVVEKTRARVPQKAQQPKAPKPAAKAKRAAPKKTTRSQGRAKK
jgi:uncharacterized protein YrrD